MERQQKLKVIVEQTEDGYIAYPLGIKGVAVAQGDTYDEALQQVHAMVQFHVETFGAEMLEEPADVKKSSISEPGGSDIE